jgi:hypothetical protein
MMLHVLIARAFFVIGAGEIRGSLKIVLDMRHQVPGSIEIGRLQHPARSTERA